MKNDLVGLVVGVVCAVILIGTVLVPNIDNYAQTHETFTNSGMYYMTDTDETLTYEYLGSNSWTVNGETLENVDSYSNIIVANGTYVRGNGQVRGEISATWVSAELTVSNGTITGTVYTSSTVSSDIEWDCSETFYGAVVEESDLLMKASGTSVYVLDSDELYGIGLTAIGSEGYVTFEISVIDGTATVTSFNDSVTVSDISLNWEQIDGYADLYEFTSVTFNATLNETTVAVTYDRIIVPSSVDAELSQHLGDTEIILISIIPLFLVLAVLCAVTYAVMRNRDY